MHKLIQKSKKAFSLIEVIFVLIILGIVASIASQILVQVYENYIMQRAVYNVSKKTEMVSNQIVNRLSYRIQGTTISKNHQEFLNGTGTTWLPLREIPVGSTYTSIEWIGYDNDSFAAEAQPYWSGIADYENADKTYFDSPGSNLTNAATIMSNLSKNAAGTSEVDLSSTQPAAVIFSNDNNYYNGTNQYNPICMGLIPEDSATSTNCIYSVHRTGNTRFNFVDSDPKIISERYKLAWSAYAIAPEDRDGDGLHDLVLYYNYQPWNGESYMDATTSRSTLMHNVTVFKFSETGGVIRFKLCAAENIGQDFNVTTCKEKVVIR